MIVTIEILKDKIHHVLTKIDPDALHPDVLEVFNITSSYTTPAKIYSEQEIASLEEKFGFKYSGQCRVFLKEIGDISIGPGDMYYGLMAKLSGSCQVSFPFSDIFEGLGYNEGYDFIIDHDTVEIALEQDRATAAYEREWDEKYSGALLLSQDESGITSWLICNGDCAGEVWQHGDGFMQPIWGKDHKTSIAGQFAIEPPYTEEEKWTFFHWYNYWLDCLINAKGWRPE